MLLESESSLLIFSIFLISDSQVLLLSTNLLQPQAKPGQGIGGIHDDMSRIVYVSTSRPTDANNPATGIRSK